MPKFIYLLHWLEKFCNLQLFIQTWDFKEKNLVHKILFRVTEFDVMRWSYIHTSNNGKSNHNVVQFFCHIFCLDRSLYDFQSSEFFSFYFLYMHFRHLFRSEYCLYWLVFHLHLGLAWFSLLYDQNIQILLTKLELKLKKLNLLSWLC